MGSGSIRYLQILVPHLVEVLNSSSVVGEGNKEGRLDESSMRMMELVAKALECLLGVANRRMEGWLSGILLATAKCWTIVRERGTYGEDTGRKESLEKTLVSLVRGLALVSEKARKVSTDHFGLKGKELIQFWFEQVDLPRLLAVDPILFQDLVPSVCSSEEGII